MNSLVGFQLLNLSTWESQYFIWIPKLLLQLLWMCWLTNLNPFSSWFSSGMYLQWYASVNLTCWNKLDHFSNPYVLRIADMICSSKVLDGIVLVPVLSSSLYWRIGLVNITRLSGIPLCASLNGFIIYNGSAVGALMLSATVFPLVPRDV